MIKRIAAGLVLALFVGAASAEAANHKKKPGGNGGGPTFYVVSCLGAKGSVWHIPGDTPRKAVLTCLASGGHPIGVVPVFKGRK